MSTEERIETDWAEVGCSKRACRYEHSYRWGQCAHAEEPPPDTRCWRWKTVTASDGHPSLVAEQVDHTEMRAEIERQVRAKVAQEIEANAERVEPLHEFDLFAETVQQCLRVVRGEL